jgi:hypothetical protein
MRVTFPLENISILWQPERGTASLSQLLKLAPRGMTPPCSAKCTNFMPSEDNICFNLLINSDFLSIIL